MQIQRAVEASGKNFRKAIFIDPGLRNPITGVDVYGNFFTVNKTLVNRINSLERRIAMHQSKLDCALDRHLASSKENVDHAQRVWIDVCKE